MAKINFTSANCKNCYKCLRSCPVKAIKIQNEQAEIIEDRCISCGHCLVICPQNARNIVSDISMVKDAIGYGKKVVASLAPSFSGHFLDLDEGIVVAALKQLGFSAVEETAIGAELVSDLYENYIQSSKKTILITTCCPSANYIIEKYYPSLVDNMIPVDSPMIVHSKKMKDFYGPDSFVVFIGPCVAKKFEASEYESENVIDAVITFEEIQNWINESKIELSTLDSLPFDREAKARGGRYPLSGGIAEGLIEVLDENKLEIVSVSSKTGCMEVLREIEEGHLNNALVELSACKGSCIGGPDMIKEEKNFYARQRKVKNYIKSKSLNESSKTYSLEQKSDECIQTYERTFLDKSLEKTVASEEDIKKIMKDMGKFEPSDELNCGVCGYNTCREKAQAVYEGMAEVNMCLNFMRSKAESLTNVIFENSPSAILLIDENFNIMELNPTAESTFVTKAELMKGKPVSTIIDNSDIIKVKETKQNILAKRVNYPQYNGIFIESIIYLEKHNIILVVMTNIIESEKNKKELMRVREKTLNAAQEVIDKQMRVAQEIASLLGETTAETKITLSRLKKMALGEDDGDSL